MKTVTDTPVASVVVPVYNAGRWLPESIPDLLGQTLHDVEFIFVDDGSTDGSVQLLEEAAARDPRVRVLRQRRRFAGCARNAGLDVARGKWFIALDADDRFEPTLLEEVVRRGEETGAEVVVFDADRLVMPEAVMVPDPSLARCGKLPGTAFQPGEGVFDLFRVTATWNKLYRMDFLKTGDHRYQETYECNDIRFTLFTLASAKTVAALARTLLHYRTGLEDSVQSNKEGHPFDVFSAYSSLKGLLEAKGLWPAFRRIYLTRAAISLLGGRISGFKSVETAEKYIERMKLSALAELGLDSVKEGDFLGSEAPFLEARQKAFTSLPFGPLLWQIFKDEVSSRERWLYTARGAKRNLDASRRDLAETKKELAQARKELAQAKREAAGAKKAFDTMRKSLSLRLGLALTWPLRMLAGAMGK